MSVERLCLRCDWAGVTVASICPSCGATLFRPVSSTFPDTSATRSGDRTAPAPAAPPASTPPADDARDARHGARSRGPARTAPGAAVAVAFVAAAIVAAGAFAWIRVHTPPPASPATGLSGRLVYAVADGDGWSRLWIWDLAANDPHEGPRVREPVELVNAYGAGAGWIGVTSRRDDGRFTGGVLRNLDPTDQATPLLTADLMAWGARGESIAGVRRAGGVGCGHVKVMYAGLVAPTGTEVRVDRRLCGDVLTVGRDDLRTYLTLRHGPRQRIVFAGLGRFHRVLDGYALAAVSPAADMLVVPASGRAGAPSWPSTAQPHGRPRGGKGAGLFFRGLGMHGAIAYGGPADAFKLDGVLGWSSDASIALVTGRLGDRWGIFELDAGPSAGQGSPRFLGPINGGTFATYTDGGTGIVDNAGTLSTLTGGRLTPLTPPAGAPTPTGPIVWIR